MLLPYKANGWSENGNNPVMLMISVTWIIERVPWEKQEDGKAFEKQYERSDGNVMEMPNNNIRGRLPNLIEGTQCQNVDLCSTSNREWSQGLTVDGWRGGCTEQSYIISSNIKWLPCDERNNCYQASGYLCYERFILLKNWQHESSRISISVSSEGTFGGIREEFLAKTPLWLLPERINVSVELAVFD